MTSLIQAMQYEAPKVAQLFPEILFQMIMNASNWEEFHKALIHTNWPLQHWFRTHAFLLVLIANHNSEFSGITVDYELLSASCAEIIDIAEERSLQVDDQSLFFDLHTSFSFLSKETKEKLQKIFNSNQIYLGEMSGLWEKPSLSDIQTLENNILTSKNFQVPSLN